jgi:hypothetical protein
VRDLAVEGGYKPLKAVLSDSRIYFVVFQTAILAVAEFPSGERGSNATDVDVQQIRES